MVEEDHINYIQQSGDYETFDSCIAFLNRFTEESEPKCLCISVWPGQIHWELEETQGISDL